MKKITILTGAGFTCTKEFANISTGYLTKKLVEHEDKNWFKGSPGKFIFKKLCEFYNKRVDYSSETLGSVNFETLIHFTEELNSYLSSKKINKIDDYKSITSSFLTLKDDYHEYITNNLGEIFNRLPDKDIFLEIWNRNLHKNWISLIINEFKDFVDDSTNKGMTNYLHNFHDKFLKPEFTTRYYTLNYDDWLTKFGGLYDGFESSIIRPERIVMDKNINCHYNLHGCVYWNDFITHDHIKKDNTIVNFQNSGGSEVIDTINREPILQTPIITGYNKPIRFFYEPFSHINFSFQNDIYTSDVLLIIGYSFIDSHINNILTNFKGNTIIVDYFNAWNQVDFEDIDPWDDEVLNFLRKVRPNGDFFGDGVELLKNEWIISKNGKVKIWWKGIGNEFYEKWNEVLKSN